MKRRLRPVVLAAAAAVAASGQAAAPASLSFDQEFRDAPLTLHYKAQYQAGGARHEVEVWLDRGTRLKRRTDGGVEVHALRASAREPEYRMTVLDLRRQMVTEIDRSKLFRLGNFTDWFELAHALRYPRGAYLLERVAAPAGMDKPLEACDWYRLTQAGRSSAICWSRSARLPLVIASQEGQVVWRVTELRRGPIADAEFEVHAEGFVRNDANGDLERD